MSRAKPATENKSDEISKTEEVSVKPFLSKGAGVGGGKGKKQENEGEDHTQNVALPEDNEEPENNTEEVPESNRSRRSRKARGPNVQTTPENHEMKLDRKNSLEEFEEIEK